MCCVLGLLFHVICYCCVLLFQIFIPCVLSLLFHVMCYRLCLLFEICICCVSSVSRLVHLLRFKVCCFNEYIYLLCLGLLVFGLYIIVYAKCFKYLLCFRLIVLLCLLLFMFIALTSYLLRFKFSVVVLLVA